MVATAPSTLARPPVQGRSASRIASDRQGATWVSPENDVSEQLTRRHDRTAASCIGRARPHRGNSYPGRRRFSGQTRIGRYCRARYYHPDLQRFLSEDPIGFAGGDVNLYAYVGNSPTDLTDPFGLDAWSDAGNLSAGFGDTLTLGGTAWVRGLWTQQFGLPDTVDASSSWNLAGRKTAHAWDAAMGILSGAAALRAAPSLVPLLTNEIGAVGRVGVRQITGYTRHGLNQAISREGTGVSVRAILDAVRNPQRIVARSGGITEYIGEAARVLLNEAGQVVTVIARGVRGFRIPRP